MRTAALRSLFSTASAIAIGLLVLAIGLAASGYDAAAALRAMGNGAFGSSDAILSAVLPRAIPLILVGAGIGLAFRGGALNIGAEGQFYAGAIAATWVGLRLGAQTAQFGAPWGALITVPAVLLSAMLAGLLWAGIPALLKLRFGVLEVISTLLLNFVAEALVSWMVQGPLQESKHIYPQSDQIAAAARLPQLAGTRLHLGLVLALVVCGGLWVFGRKTMAGFTLRATGANPVAATIVGRINTSRVFAIALMASGALAGLAGGAEISGTTYALFQNLSPGYGFTGIAVALLAKLDPLATIGTGLLFAALEAGATAMQRDAGVPAIAVYVVEATVIIVVLLADAGRQRAAARITAAEG